MLAEYLQVTRQAIHGFKKTKVPLEILVEICVNEDISLDWLLLGRGEPEIKENDLDEIKKGLTALEKKNKK